MDFARKQLSKHGWTDGQGLGKEEEGIKEAIKVKIKQDKKGVGHDPGEEFSFHWWDHVFNKAASKIQVNTTEDGVEVKNSGDTKVSKKKDCKTYDNKAMLYGQFVKGSTLSNGLETREKTLEDSSDEEPGEATQCLMPDQEEIVFKMCGGRTAHKGARHGLKLNGKLLRIQEQEKLLLDSYNSKSSSQKDQHKSHNHFNELEVESTQGHESGDRKGYVEKSKKKKRKHRDEEITEEMTEEINNDTKEILELESQSVENLGSVNKPKKRKKSKKSRKNSQCDNVEAHGEGKDGCNNSTAQLGAVDTKNSGEIDSALTENSEVGRKIKKKKKKQKGD
ncbi:G patch domain-containing protein 4-like [Mercenaria mercenaria]|uniref:G patch domain-containing protein 4-like n=1 Tax=Mercenaria mercenaria TaxID=6596 RepID=UPI00234E8A4A|nr:G patch domain-containing protein 4-like [Mercenaria mercenaria]